MSYSSWNYQYKGIKPIWDYEAAAVDYNNIVPIRGSDNVRPLGNRRNKEVQICERKLFNGTTAYAVQYYDTDVVTFYPTGEIHVSIDGWNTYTTAQVIQAVLGEACWQQNSNLWLSCDDGEKRFAVLIPIDETIELERRFVVSNDVLMRANEHGSPVPEGTLALKSAKPEITVYKKNRAQTNNVRQRYEPFLTYLRGMTKLLGESHFTKEHYIQVFGETEHTYETYQGVTKTYRSLNRPHDLRVNGGSHFGYDFLMDIVEIMESGDREQWSNLMYRLAYSCEVASPRNILVAANDLLFLIHREEVFEVTTKEAAHNYKSSNDRYFKTRILDSDGRHMDSLGISINPDTQVI